MSPQILDAGVASKSVSASFMKLVNVHHEMDSVDFDQIVKFLEENLDNIISDVHKFDKLMLDDGEVRVFERDEKLGMEHFLYFYIMIRRDNHEANQFHEFFSQSRFF